MTLPELTDLLPYWGKWYEALKPTMLSFPPEDDGGLDDANDGWPGGRHTAYQLPRLITLRSYASGMNISTTEIDILIRRMISFLLRRQDSRWGIDLSGFYSPNEVGFTLPGLAHSYRQLQAAPGMADVAGQLKQYLLAGAEAVLAGQAYTANHRWTAAAGPLAAVHALWPDARYLAKIEDYLSDGFDIDEDGSWYEERSPNYNIVANAGILCLADSLKRPELLSLVQRNLDYVILFLQPNDEMDTSYSHRQDRAQPNRMACSLSQARRFALLTGDGRYTTLALHAWAKGDRALEDLTPSLSLWDDCAGKWPEPVPLTNNYVKKFTSQIVRHRREKRAITLAADPGNHFYDSVMSQWGTPHLSDDWFHMHWGGVVLQSLQLAGGGMCNMQPQTIQETSPDTYRLAGEIPGWTHTLHFRPGRPKYLMPWGWKFEAEVQAGKEEVGIALRSTSDNSLIASLNFWIRPGVEVREGEESLGELKAGKHQALRGSAPLRLIHGNDMLEITGLPAATHRRFLNHGSSIPSGITKNCGALYLGLRFPIDLSFKIATLEAPKK